MIFTLHFPTVDCSLEGATFETAEAAIDEGRRAGFSFSVFQGQALIYTWCPISGGKHYGFARGYYTTRGGI